MREGLRTVIKKRVYSVGRKSVSAATVKLIGLTIRTLADEIGFVENITQEKIATYASVEHSTVTRAVTVLNNLGLLNSHRIGRRRPASHAHDIGLLRTEDLRARAAADKRRVAASGHTQTWPATTSVLLRVQGKIWPEAHRKARSSPRTCARSSLPAATAKRIRTPQERHRGGGGRRTEPVWRRLNRRPPPLPPKLRDVPACGNDARSAPRGKGAVSGTAEGSFERWPPCGPRRARRRR